MPEKSYGIRVMLAMFENHRDSIHAFQVCLGKTITALVLDDDLQFTFADGTRMKLFDDGQSCCESRYMHTDDNLEYFIGGTLLTAEIREAPDLKHEDGIHEVQFLLVTTSKGSFTIETHNEHNGYYGGFCVKAALIDDTDSPTT